MTSITTAPSPRLAVVTGGASGIGAACARVLAEEGWKVAVVDRNAEAALAVANATGGAAFECDIGDESSVNHTAAAVESSFGPITAVVNCAGVVQGRMTPEEMPIRKWDDIVRIDQRGTYLVCMAFAQAMKTRRKGAIVNIASVAGIRSMPLHCYGPAKAAVIAMSATLAAEWGNAGIRVNAISPGFTRTEGMLLAFEKQVMNEDWLTSGAALRRLVEPAEVGRAAAFLVSDAASGITGINLPVDCGWLAGSGWAPYGGLPA